MPCRHEAHVRVDFLYDRMTSRTQSLINIFGTVLFLVPLSLLILFGSFAFVGDSYSIQEISEDPGGLPYRWVVKSYDPDSLRLSYF